MKYKVILADPPWKYSNKQSGAAENQYSTMSTQELCELKIDRTPVQDVGSDNSILILWCTWPLMPDGLKIVEAWGYKYVTGFPWVKLKEPVKLNLFGEVSIIPTYGTGYWVRGCSEFVIIAKRGKASPPKSNFLGILGERMQHSRKPDTIYDFAESLDGPYIELFARRLREGWTSWGNEV